MIVDLMISVPEKLQIQLSDAVAIMANEDFPHAWKTLIAVRCFGVVLLVSSCAYRIVSISCEYSLRAYIYIAWISFLYCAHIISVERQCLNPPLPSATTGSRQEAESHRLQGERWRAADCSLHLQAVSLVVMTCTLTPLGIDTNSNQTDSLRKSSLFWNSSARRSCSCFK